MTERDIELAKQAKVFADRDFKGKIYWGEAYESKLNELIRADEREACCGIVWGLCEPDMAQQIVASFRTRERYICPQCGNRRGEDVNYIHRCTPPRAKA